MFHWNTHHHPWLHENDGRLFPMDETLKLARAHPYVAQEWHVKFYANVAGRRASHMQRGSDIRYIFSWRVILTKKTRLHLLLHAGE